MNHPVLACHLHTSGRACGTLPSPKNYTGKERSHMPEKLYGYVFSRLERTMIDVANRSGLSDLNVYWSQSGRGSMVGIIPTPTTD